MHSLLEMNVEASFAARTFPLHLADTSSFFAIIEEKLTDAENALDHCSESSEEVDVFEALQRRLRAPLPRTGRGRGNSFTEKVSLFTFLISLLAMLRLLPSLDLYTCQASITL